MARNLKLIEREWICELYANNGLSGTVISKLTGYSQSTVYKALNDLSSSRTYQEATKLAHSSGRFILTDAGRAKLSKHGQKMVQNGSVIWTKPERAFCDILRGEGLGVGFPDFVEHLFNVESDTIKDFMFQYPIGNYTCDYADPVNKIAVRVQGDFWHANPIMYDGKSLFKTQVKNVRQDKNSRFFFERNGWKVIDIWESEIYWNKPLVVNKIRMARKLVTPSVLHADTAGFDPQAIHQWQERSRNLWFKKDKVGRPRKSKLEIKLVERICKRKECGKTFLVRPYLISKRKFCCPSCHSLNDRRVERPSKEALSAEIKEMSWLALGRKYKVSGNAVKKWAVSYGLLG